MKKLTLAILSSCLVIASAGVMAKGTSNIQFGRSAMSSSEMTKDTNPKEAMSTDTMPAMAMHTETMHKEVIPMDIPFFDRVGK